MTIISLKKLENALKKKKKKKKLTYIYFFLIYLHDLVPRVGFEPTKTGLVIPRNNCLHYHVEWSDN